MIKYLIVTFLLVNTVLLGQLTKIEGTAIEVSSNFGATVAVSGSFAAVGEPASDVFTNVNEKVQIYKRVNGNWSLHKTIFSEGQITAETRMGGRIAMTDRWLVFSREVKDNGEIHIYERVLDEFIFREIIEVHPDLFSRSVKIALTDEHLSFADSDGVVHFYKLQNDKWEEIQTVWGGDGFGTGIAIYEDIAVVGSWLYGGGSISIFEYDGNEWSILQELYPSDESNPHKFGMEISIIKDVITVSDFIGYYGSSSDVSATYIFENNNGLWTETQKLVSPSGAHKTNFGKACALNKDYLFISSNIEGKVYKYKKSNQGYELINTYYEKLGHFGQSLALSKNTLIIGNSFYNFSKGAIYFAQVTENLLPIVSCQLPTVVLGNEISIEQLGDGFIADSINSIEDFGVFDIENYFENNPFVGFCFYDTIGEAIIDIFGFDIVENPDLQITWEGRFEKEGVEYSAVDVLDNIHSIKPKLDLPIISPMEFEVSFGDIDTDKCISYDVIIYFSQFVCSNETVYDTIVAGDTISLRPNCIISEYSNSFNYNWKSDPPSVIPHLFEPSITPVETALYTLNLHSNVGNEKCSGEVFHHVKVIKIDNDDDGFYSYEDCDDENPDINPLAIDVIGNGIDEDCDGMDEGLCHIRKPGFYKANDAMVAQNDNNFKYGQNGSLNIRGYYGELKSVLLNFDLRNIPDDAIIDSAYLSLFFNPLDNIEISDINYGENGFYVQRIIEEWNEIDVKWSNQPEKTNTNRVVIPNSLKPREDVKVDVTSLVSDMVSLNEKYGFKLEMKDKSNLFHSQLLYASSEHTNKELHPELKVCWRVNTSTEDVMLESLSILITPNLLTDELTVVNKGKRTNALIISTQGTVQLRISLAKGENNIEVECLDPGFYYLRTQNNIIRKFVKI